MACFLVSTAEAVAVSVAEKQVKKKKAAAADLQDTPKVPLHVKLRWLKQMLFGGAILLLLEHIWHGEIVPWFPFLTAMENSEDMLEVFKEMATVGTSMALLITVVWFVMCKVADSVVKKADRV